MKTWWNGFDPVERFLLGLVGWVVKFVLLGSLAGCMNTSLPLVSVTGPTVEDYVVMLAVAGVRMTRPELPDDLEKETGEAPTEAVKDDRPVVKVYVTTSCAACNRLKADVASYTKIRWEFVDQSPEWVTSWPTLHWKGSDGWKQQAGWTDLSTFLRVWQNSMKAVSAQATAQDVGQAPTPIAEVRRVLALLSPQPNETFVDYGCGDGRWLIEAVRTYGCRAVGVEIDPEQADRARRAVDESGLVGRVQIIEGDVLTANVEAQVGVAYLYPDLLARLKPKLLKLSRFATPYHPIEGVQMQQSGDAWIWQRPAQQAQQPYAVYGGQAYTGRVCNNPRCQMCNAIQQQLAAQQQPARRWVLRSVPCASCQSGYKQIWVLE